MKNAILNLQYQYSRLFNLGLNRKKFECVSTPDKLYAMNTSKNTFIALLFTLLVSGHLFSGFIVGLSSTENLGFGFYISFSILFLVGLIGLRQFLWLAKGLQELTIENGTLTLCKKGTFLTKPRTFLMEKVQNVRPAFNEDNQTLFEKIQNNITVNRKVIFEHVFGQILFDYDGKTVKIFSDLDKSERLQLIDEINKRK
ncbi:MAG: hypothetical protein ACXITV_08585 [Luteibaculaceae bacterium]